LTATPPVGKGEKAVAEWIQAMGGKAVWADGAIQEVSLGSTPVTDLQLEVLGELPNLRRLDLRSTEIGDLGIQFFSRAEKLTELALDHTLTTDQGLAHLASLKSLRKVGLGYTLVRGEGFADLKDLEALAQVSLAGAPVTDSGLKQLALVKNLDHLSLNHTDITNEGMSQLKNLKKLTHLNLAGTDIGDEGLAQLGEMSGLVELALSYGRFTDKGLKSLEGLGSLRVLELVRTRVGEAGLQSIAQLKSLTSLNLDYAGVTDVSYAGVRERTGDAEERAARLPHHLGSRLQSADPAWKLSCARHRCTRRGISPACAAQKGGSGRGWVADRLPPLGLPLIRCARGRNSKIDFAYLRLTYEHPSPPAWHRRCTRSGEQFSGRAAGSHARRHRKDASSGSRVEAAPSRFRRDRLQSSRARATNCGNRGRGVEVPSTPG